MRYIISYDLIAASSDKYQDLYNALEQLEGERILESQWVIEKYGTNPTMLYNQLIKFLIDSTIDHLLITELDGSGWACSPNVGLRKL